MCPKAPGHPITHSSSATMRSPRTGDVSALRRFSRGAKRSGKQDVGVGRNKGNHQRDPLQEKPTQVVEAVAL